MPKQAERNKNDKEQKSMTTKIENSEKLLKLLSFF